MTYNKQDIDKLFRDTINRLHPGSWPSGCGWEIEIDSFPCLVVTYDEHVKHWPDINGGCTDYCTYKPKVVKVPL